MLILTVAAQQQPLLHSSIEKQIDKEFVYDDFKAIVMPAITAAPAVHLVILLFYLL
ncbi:hypothetical protein ACFQ3S_09510 [Mucilaginibacter terrae]|uniref:hypothetical protein n=1 Tax=Mucilaginibacter terrae TaxID=1955052 RepID=UPI00363DA4D7